MLIPKEKSAPNESLGRRSHTGPRNSESSMRLVDSDHSHSLGSGSKGDKYSNRNSCTISYISKDSGSFDAASTDPQLAMAMAMANSDNTQVRTILDKLNHPFDITWYPHT